MYDDYAELLSLREISACDWRAMLLFRVLTCAESKVCLSPWTIVLPPLHDNFSSRHKIRGTCFMECAYDMESWRSSPLLLLEVHVLRHPYPYGKCNCSTEVGLEKLIIWAYKCQTPHYALLIREEKRCRAERSTCSKEGWFCTEKEKMSKILILYANTSSFSLLIINQCEMYYG